MATNNQMCKVTEGRQTRDKTRLQDQARPTGSKSDPGAISSLRQHDQPVQGPWGKNPGLFDTFVAGSREGEERESLAPQALTQLGPPGSQFPS